MRAKLHKRIERHLMYLDNKLCLFEHAVAQLNEVSTPDEVTAILIVNVDNHETFDQLFDRVWRQYRRILVRRNRFVDLYWHAMPEDNEAANLLNSFNSN